MYILRKIGAKEAGKCQGSMAVSVRILQVSLCPLCPLLPSWVSHEEKQKHVHSSCNPLDPGVRPALPQSWRVTSGFRLSPCKMKGTTWPGQNSQLLSSCNSLRAQNVTVSSFHCTNLEGMFQNNCLFTEKISFPALMSYLVNVNRAFKIIFSRFTSRNKCFRNGLCSPKSHESTSAFQVRHGSLPMRVPCVVDTLENSPKISQPLPPQAIEWVEKKNKGVRAQADVNSWVSSAVLHYLQVENFLKGTHCAPLWAIYPLAKSIVVNKVTWDKMCQNCSLSSWDFVVTHDSDLSPSVYPLALADGNSEGLWLILFSFLRLCAIFL